MIAIIRTREKGRSQFLCELDIMQFTENQVRDRMIERGIKDDTFVICGFSDWNVDRMMSLSEVDLLKRCIVGLYDGDDYIVQYLLKKGLSVLAIVTKFYVFLSKDEKEAMRYVLKNVSFDSLIDFWQRSVTWVNALNAYIQSGILLNTSKGFYVLKTEGG
ncbi:hypothetical protein [Streptococcus canis]|uniref:Uncharacterized protein n=1 Tax=Streptococcus canis TaxID=1329 RepID=A0AAE4TRF2_STRCB|nr:hypothetical protein [Streptococcus canis]MDV5976893.1 hypothetical protein [Streptococcus canis]